jgi:hypothetical protein
MRYPFDRPVGPFFLLCIAATVINPPQAQAQLQTQAMAVVQDFWTLNDPGSWRLMASPYTRHWRYSAEHQNVYALGGEYQRADGVLNGAAYFRNSFGQPSAYVYAGRRYGNVFDTPELYWQWSAGLLYGYKGRYKNKVPLNVAGFAPGAVLSAGWQFNKNAGLGFHLLGDAGVMVQFSWDLH